MIAYAAIDLRGGRVVQLVGGKPEKERIALPDPLAVARRWIDAGFAALHVVDLDAALESGNNREAIAEILQAVSVPVQVGGGVRDDAAAKWLISAGAARIVVGTRAIEDPAWLDALTHRYPERVVVAVDMDQEQVLVRGWTFGIGLNPARLFQRLDRMALAALLVTDVSREGKAEGVNVDWFRSLTRVTRHPLIAAGGIASMDDLRALADAGVAGAVLGMALYTGRLDPAAVAREFGS